MSTKRLGRLKWYTVKTSTLSVMNKYIRRYSDMVKRWPSDVSVIWSRSHFYQISKQKVLLIVQISFQTKTKWARFYQSYNLFLCNWCYFLFAQPYFNRTSRSHCIFVDRHITGKSTWNWILSFQPSSCNGWAGTLFDKWHYI